MKKVFEELISIRFATGFQFPLPWSKLWDNLLCNWTAKKCKWDPKVGVMRRDVDVA